MQKFWVVTPADLQSQVHFVNGMEGWPLCNCMGHCVISVLLKYRLLTLRAGAEGVNVFLRVLMIGSHVRSL